MTGEAKDIKECSDPVFAQEIVGKGIMIIPSDGKCYSPVDGKVSMLAETGHAIGITSNDGIEILIHIGLDTVELNGSAFDIKVENNSEIKKGDLLLEFDIEKIEEAGKKTQSPTLITNTDDKEITPLASGNVVKGDDLSLIHI